MSTIKVGIIGTGFGKIIGQNFKAIAPNVKLFFTGRDQKKLHSVQKELNAEGIYPTWQEMVRDPQINLLVIASHSSAHKEMFTLASKYCKNILIEKPAALNSKEVIEMQQLQSESSSLKNIVVNHEGRFHPVVSCLKKLVSKNQLGEILTFRTGAYLNWYSNPDYKENWNQYSDQGGGQILSIGTHQIDLARHILDNPQIIDGNVQTSCYADMRFSSHADAETHFTAHFITQNNTSIQIYNDSYCFGYKDFTIEIVGSKGIVMYSDQKGLYLSQHNSESLKKIEVNGDLDLIPLGNSILSKGMKYEINPLIDLMNGKSADPRFCSLADEAVNLEILEKYK